MDYVKNKKKLISRGNTRVRIPLLEIVNHALAQADPYKAAVKLVSLNGDILKIGELEFNLSNYKRVFVIGTGKATFPIARALEEILGTRITGGAIICKEGQEGELSRIKIYLASHPIPNEAGFAAARSIMEIARQTEPGDFVFSCITGGSSALMPYPVAGITLDEKKEVNKLLLGCGANIVEINAVRKHLSQIKGGWLARNISPGVPIINLTVSDVIGDPLDYITCPTVEDTSFFADARATMNKYKLWDKVPVSVRDYLRNAGDELETPKDLSDRMLHNFILVPSDAACEGAAQKAEEMGFNTMILSTMLEGESKEVGATFAAVAREILINGRPALPPCVIIGGGETTVRITGPAGEGGPNQEFALGAAPFIDRAGDVAVIGLDTDGTDGPTGLAGGIVDDQTVTRARQKSLDIFASLEEHESSRFLQELGDEVFTGATGTNVNDLKIALILPKE